VTNLLDQLSIVTGVLRYDDLAYLALVDDASAPDGMEHTIFLEWDAGTLRRPDLDVMAWAAAGGTCVSVPSSQGLFVGLSGQVYCIGGGDIHTEQILAGRPDGPETFGPLRAVKAVGGTAYAVGMGRQVYRRTGCDAWERIDLDVRTSLADNHLHSFETIDGFSPADLFAAGRRGEIWHYTRGGWVQEPSPMTTTITALLCASDGAVYACGLDATVARRTASGWEQIEHNATSGDLWSLAELKGRIFCSGFHGVFEVVDGGLRPVDFGADPPQTTFCLTTADQVLWSIGAKDVVAFDGSMFSRVL
jgi:hypothetical protein